MRPQHLLQCLQKGFRLHNNGRLAADESGIEPVRARTLVEALAPANRITANASPLLRQLLDDGLVRTRMMMTPEGVPAPSSGLDVLPHPYRPVRADGSDMTGLYVLGLQLSANQWGTAIAAEAIPERGPVYPSGQRTLRDADEIARAVLRGTEQPS